MKKCLNMLGNQVNVDNALEDYNIHFAQPMEMIEQKDTTYWIHFLVYVCGMVNTMDPESNFNKKYKLKTKQGDNYVSSDE